MPYHSTPPSPEEIAASIERSRRKKPEYWAPGASPVVPQFTPAPVIPRTTPLIPRIGQAPVAPTQIIAPPIRPPGYDLRGLRRIGEPATMPATWTQIPPLSLLAGLGQGIDWTPPYEAEDQYTRAGQKAKGEFFSPLRNLGEFIQRRAAISDYIQEQGTDAEKLRDMGPAGIQRGLVRLTEAARSLGLGADTMENFGITTGTPGRLQAAMLRAEEAQAEEDERKGHRWGSWLGKQRKYMFGTGGATEEDPRYGAVRETLMTMAPIWEETQERTVGQVLHVLDQLVPGNKADMEKAIIANNLSEEDAKKARKQYVNYSNWNEELLGDRPGTTNSPFGWNWPSKQGRGNELADWFVEGQLGGREQFKDLPVLWQIITTIGPALLAGAPATTVAKFAQLGKFAKVGKGMRLFGKAYSLMALDPAYWGSYMMIGIRNARSMNRLGTHLFSRAAGSLDDTLRTVAKGGEAAFSQETTSIGRLRRFLADLRKPTISGFPAVETARGTRGATFLAKARELTKILRISDESRAGAVMGQASATLQNWLEQSGKHAAQQVRFLEHIIDLDDPKTAGAARNALDAMGFNDRAVPVAVKRAWNLPTTDISQLDSSAGHITRGVIRELAGTTVQRERIADIVRRAKAVIPDDASIADIKKIKKGAEEAGNELMALMADASARVAGVSGKITEKGAKKYLGGWRKGQGWYAKVFHMGPVPGLAVRNASVDLVTMALNHGYSWKAGKFVTEWGGKPEAVSRTFGGFRAVRDFEGVVRDDLTGFKGAITKWGGQLGLTLSSMAESKNAVIAWAKGARYVFDRFWRSGAVSDGVIDANRAALGVTDELADSLKIAVRTRVKTLDKLTEVIDEVLRPGIKWRRGEIPEDMVEHLNDLDILDEVQEILTRHTDSGNLDGFIDDIENLRTRKWTESLPPDFNLVPEGSPQAKIIEYLEEVMEDFKITPANRTKIRDSYGKDLRKWRMQMEMNQGWAQYTIDQIEPGDIRNKLQRDIDEAVGLRTQEGEVITTVGAMGIEEAKAGTAIGQAPWDSYRRARDEAWFKWQADFIEKMQKIMREAEDALGGPQISGMPDDVAARYRPIAGADLLDEAVERAASAPIKTPTGRLPRELSGARTYYSSHIVTFDSDVEKALYIVRNKKTLSKGDAKYMAWLRTQYPDLTDDAIRKTGNDVHARVNTAARNAPDKKSPIVMRAGQAPRVYVQAPRAAPVGRSRMSDTVADAMDTGRPYEERMTYDYTSAAPRDMAIDKLRKRIADAWDTPIAEVTEGVSTNAVRKLTSDLRAELSAVRQLSDRFGGEFRDYVLHNYGKRYNFDTALAVPFGYPFWYTRTYAKWFAKAMGQDPFAVAAVYRLNNTMEQWNRDIEAETGVKVPHYLSRALQVLPFGLENMFGGHVAIPILKNFIPIQGALDGQFRNTERLKNAVGANFEGLYGFGLGSHALIPQILAGTHWILGRNAGGKSGEAHMKQAMQYTGYLGSAMRSGSSLSAQATNALGLDMPGGIGLEPAAAIMNMLKASSMGKAGTFLGVANAIGLLPQVALMWARRPGKPGKLPMYVGTIYDQGRTDKMLARMEHDGRISHEVAMDAALVSENPQRFLDSEEMIENGAVEAWETAVRESRLEKAGHNYMSLFGGPAFIVRGKYELETQALYEETSRLYELTNDPDSDPDEVALLWTTHRLKNPHLSVASMARRMGSDRESNYTWDVLSRIGRGKHTKAIYDSIAGEGFYDIVDEWYKTKGNIKSKADRDRMSEGILLVGMNIELPDLPTGVKWKEAGLGRKEIYETLELLYPGTEAMLEHYNDFGVDYDAKDAYRRENPDLDQRLKEENVMMLSDKYKETVAPYYVSEFRAKQFLTVMHDKPFEEKYPDVPTNFGPLSVPQVYHWFKAVSGPSAEDWPLETRKAYINSIPGMSEYDVSYKAFTKELDENLALLAQHIPEPLLPTVRKDAPEGTLSTELQEVVKGLGPLLSKSEGGYQATGTVADQDISDPTFWLDRFNASQEISQVYFDDNKELWLTNALKPILADSKITSVSQWDVSKDTPLLSGWPVDAKGSDALIAYVRQQGATSLREAMMLETRNGVHKELGAWRVIGTILSLSPAEIRTLADTVSELHDIERVNWYAIGNPQPTLDVLMRSMGFRAAFDKKGVLSLRKEADIKPLLTDENDRFIGDKDIREYIRNLSEAEWGPDIDLLKAQYIGLYNAGQLEAADALLKDEPLIAAYYALEQEIFARFRAAKAGPGSKTFIKFMADVAAGKRTGDISKLMQSVLSGGSRMETAVSSAAKKSRAKSVSASKIRSTLFDFHVLREPKPSRPRQTSARVQRQQTTAQPPPPDLTPWLTLQAKLKAENPGFLTALMDFFDLSAYARGAHLQRNPDLARWLATVPAAQLAAIERAYYIWAQQTGRITPRQERRVSRSRPALGSTLRVYKPRGERAGI